MKSQILNTLSEFWIPDFSLFLSPEAEKEVLELLFDLLEQEKNKMLEKISPDSAEYLQAYAYLVNKGRQLGIQPGKFNF